MPHRPVDPTTIHTLLILKPSSLGDIVHTLPAVALLKRTMPNVRFRWLVNPEWAPLLEGNPDLDEIILFPRKELRGLRVFRQLRWLRKLRTRYRSDLVLDFQGLLRSAIMGRVCRGRQFLGLGDAREGARYFYDESAPVAGAAHAIDRYLKLAKLAGAEFSADEPLPSRLPEGNAPEGFDETEPYLLLHPFSRGKGKSMTEAHVAELCRALPCRVVIAGRAEGVTLPELPNVTNLLNATTLSELIWLLRQARFVVSVDSGPMHMAAELRKPMLSIHTWSDPAKVGPYFPQAWILKEGELYRQERPEKRRKIANSEALAGFLSDEINSYPSC